MLSMRHGALRFALQRIGEDELGSMMASAMHARAQLCEDDFREALDGVVDLVPLRRDAQARRPLQEQLQAWVHYAEHLESRLEQVHAQVAALARRSEFHALLLRGAGAEPRPAAGAGADDATRCELLARVRAEQLMGVRLLHLLARCADLELLTDPEGEVAALMDARRRRELRSRDLEESRAEYLALLRAGHDQQARAQENARESRLPLPGLVRCTN